MKIIIALKEISIRYLYYIRRALSLPPAETFRIVRRRISTRLAALKGKFTVKVRGSELSDREFLKTLVPESLGSWESYLRHMRTGNRPVFFLDGIEPSELCTFLDEMCPGYRVQVIAAADRVCRHEFDLLGSGPTDLGKRIDWHSDFITRHPFEPRAYYTDIRYALFPGGFDIKVPWELSRCQHFAWLGQAYWFTGDETYAREFVSQTLDWIQSNKPKKGVNWVCAMDVAIRAVNWIWGYAYFRHSPSLNDAFRRKFFKSLLIHGRHIMNNLEWMEHLTSNHYLSDIVGLVYLGIYLPEFAEAEKWRDFSLHELEKEMSKQVYEDGMDFEASMSYHRLVLELFASAAFLAILNGHTFSSSFMERLEKMFEFLMQVTKPDGTAPLIGDNDNGRLHRLKAWNGSLREWSDYRYLLAVGAVLFERDDFGRAAGPEWEEALWLFGKRAYAYKQTLGKNKISGVELRSCAFMDSGICIIRDGGWYMAVTAGPNGQNGNAGHTHNDSLSFELYGNGTAWIIDPGTCVYTSDYAARNLYRSVLQHNTVAVDREEQNRMNPMVLFRMEDDSHARIIRFEETDDAVVFCGEHSGYRRLPKPVTHRRTIFRDRIDDVWLIRDTFHGETGHDYIFTLQFAPGVTVEPVNDPGGGVRATVGSAALSVVSCAAETPGITIETGSVSPGYGVKYEAPLLRFHWQDTPEFTVALVPGGDFGKLPDRIQRAQKRFERSI